MDLKEKSVVELKALWLDQLAQIEQCQNNIRVLKQEIELRPKEVKEAVETK